jgi:dTDP-4-dehydrorhamnose reductase
MRTLIFGAKGQLGKDLMQVFHDAGEAWGLDLPEVDIADELRAHAVVEEYAPNLIVNAAAYTDVDGAQDHLEEAFRINEVGARVLAEQAAYYRVPIVHYSTDYVFNGAGDRPYRPGDALDPIGVYGKSKAAGEAAVRKAQPHHFILRTAWLYGPGGNNFVEKILRAARERSSLNVVADEVGSPTHTWDLAQATVALARTSAYGTYHAVNRGPCSRFEQAQAIVQLAGLNTAVNPCSSSEYPTKAPRPCYSVLDVETLEAATGQEMRPWRQALEHYMQRREPR